MSEIRTEEEQVQAIKNWWKENGKSLLLGIAGAAAITVGWQQWQSNQAAYAEAASISYLNYVDAVSGYMSSGDQALLTTAGTLADEIKAEYDDTVYAQYTALIQAKLDVEAGELDEAVSELEWIKAQEPSARLATVADLRLAKVHFAAGDLDAALSTLASVKGQGFDELAYELEGDVLVAQGKLALARDAYEQAQAAGTAGASRGLLGLKLSDLAVEEG